MVTNGTYAETGEVLARLLVLECERFERATEIAARLLECPGPEHVRVRARVNVRLIDAYQPDVEG